MPSLVCVAPNQDEDEPNGGGGSDVPIGTIIMWPGLTVNPPNYMALFGQAIDKTEYGQLYEVIGDAYSAGGASAPQGAIVAQTYNKSGTTVTFTMGPSQVNFNIGVGDTIFLNGFGSITGTNLNGTKATILTATAIGAVGGTMTAQSFIPGNGTGTIGTIQRTTFNVPNPSGKTVRAQSFTGAVPFYTKGQIGGNDSITISADNLPEHKHGYFAGGSTSLVGSGNRAGDPNSDALGLNTFGTYTNATGRVSATNAAVDVRNAFMVLGFCIKFV